jgi:polar amino acid transport system substrate-binding protein
MPAGDPDWLRIVNLWVEQFNASGDNKVLFKKWFGMDPPKIQADY